jgi:hypothetical protein
VVHVAHLLDLQIYAGSFETGQWASGQKWCAAFLKADTYWDCVQHGGP